jgi:hypothetical protein
MIMITCSKCKTLGLAAEGSKRCHDCAEKKRAKKRRKAAEAAEARAVGASGGLASETAGSGTGEKSHTPTPSTQQSQAVLTEGGQAAALLQKIEQDVTCTVRRPKPPRPPPSASFVQVLTQASDLAGVP